MSAHLPVSQSTTNTRGRTTAIAKPRSRRTRLDRLRTPRPRVSRVSRASRSAGSRAHPRDDRRPFSTPDTTPSPSDGTAAPILTCHEPATTASYDDETPSRRSSPGHPARPPGRGRRRERRQERPEPASRRRDDDPLELPRARSALARGRLAACGRSGSSPATGCSPGRRRRRSCRRPTSGRCGRASSSSRSTCACRTRRSRASSRPRARVTSILGTGRDAPDPREAGLDRFPTTTVDVIGAAPGRRLPGRLGGRRSPRGPPPPPPTSSSSSSRPGTTGTPKGVMLAHSNVVASIETFHRIVPRMEHRIVSLLPLSHLLEQAVGLFYALSVGADILYVRSRNPRVIFDALRDHRVTSMVVVPQVLDLFWSAIEREVAKRDRETAFTPLARDRPTPADVLAAAPVRERPQAARRPLPAVPVGRRVPAAGPPAGVGGPRRDRPPGLRRDRDRHRQQHAPPRPRARHGREAAGGRRDAHRRGRRDPVQGPDRVQRLLAEPDATAAAFTEDGWYKTGDIGHLDPEGRLILSGRIKDIIVLPNGFNVYPEDIENALRIAGIRDSVVLETQPGRIEAVVLGVGGGRAGGRGRRGHRVAATPRSGGRPRATRRRRQGRQRDPRPEPADRRLAAVARRGLPAHPHAQDQAGRGPRLDRGRLAAAGRLAGPSSRRGSRSRARRARPRCRPPTDPATRPAATGSRRRSSRPGG